MDVGASGSFRGPEDLYERFEQMAECTRCTDPKWGPSTDVIEALSDILLIVTDRRVIGRMDRRGYRNENIERLRKIRLVLTKKMEEGGQGIPDNYLKSPILMKIDALINKLRSHGHHG